MTSGNSGSNRDPDRPSSDVTLVTSQLIPLVFVESSPSPLVIHVLKKLSHLNLIGTVNVDALATKSDGGGFGDVYEGVYLRQTGERTRVAVKRLRFRKGASDDELHKFYKSVARELRIWSELRHPNIMPLLGFIVEGSYPSFISKWMERGSLYSCLRILTRTDSISMILDMTCGLAYMHDRGAIHSDIKSDNVLVTSDGHAVLTDFGVSRMDTLSSGYSTRSPAGSIRWQAKEFFPLVVDDSGHPPQHTFMTDVWALGMTIYELVARTRPYGHIELPCVVMWRIANGYLPEKPAFSDDPTDMMIEQILWAICENCWNIDPKSRPSMRNLEILIRDFQKIELQVS